MNRSRLRAAVTLSAMVVAGAALAWTGWAGSRLYYNGKVVSTGLITRQGVTYVPLKDVAAALALTIQPRSDGCALVHPGGGMQVEGLNGKIGDDLFNGETRLKVVKVVRGDTYQRQFSQGSDYTAPPGQDIVAVVLRMKNGTNKTLFPNVTGKDPTALTDEDEHVYEGGSFPDGAGRNINLLPGAAADFALVFTVPKSAKLKDLVYTVDSAGVKSSTFRISLKQPEKESQ